MLTLSAVLHVLDWEQDFGVYLSRDPECGTTWLAGAEWVPGQDLRNSYDWKKERVRRVKRAEAGYLLILANE